MSEREKIRRQAEKVIAFPPNHKEEAVRLSEGVLSLLREVEELEKKCKEFREALIWCSGAEDFQEGGKARVGWQKLQDRLLKKPTQEEDQRDG